MAKLILFLTCVIVGLFGTIQSFSFKCSFYTGDFGILASIYRCEVHNSVIITSPDAAQINSVYGTHQAGYNNDNVEGFQVATGQIHYFPHELGNFFRNLKAISIHVTGLKELHQSDMKTFTNLKNLMLWSNNLEILEENLFDFNQNLEAIYLYSNKISHIDPNVFDKLTKLTTIFLGANSCINMDAVYNRPEVQKIIGTAKSQCTNSDYSNLDQKVKNLEIESKHLTSEIFKEKLKNLDDEVENSKFPNTFHHRLQVLKSLQVIKAQKEAKTTTTTTPKPTKKPATTQPRITTTVAATTSESIKFGTCSALESKVDDMAADLKDLKSQISNQTCINKSPMDNNHCKEFRDNLRNQSEVIERIDNRTEAMNTRIEILEERVENFKISVLREILQTKTAVKDANYGLVTSLNFKTEKFVKKIEKIEENMAKIIKALKIND